MAPAGGRDGPPPPDGGWGWFIVLSSFTLQALTIGITYTFGVIFVKFMDVFEVDEATTAWIGSIQPCLLYLTGKPFLPQQCQDQVLLVRSHRAKAKVTLFSPSQKSTEPTKVKLSFELVQSLKTIMLNLHIKYSLLTQLSQRQRCLHDRFGVNLTLLQHPPNIHCLWVPWRDECDCYSIMYPSPQGSTLSLPSHLVSLGGRGCTNKFMVGFKIRATFGDVYPLPEIKS